MRKIHYIVVHAAATPPDMDIGAHEIRQWHTNPMKNPETGLWRYLGSLYRYEDLPRAVMGKEGRGWRDIGYHNVIRRSGVLEAGRPIVEAGAHVKGHNKNSIGVCLVGGIDTAGNVENNFTAPQFATLRGYLDTMLGLFPMAKVVGHRDLLEKRTKECPCFDVRAWYNQ